METYRVSTRYQRLDAAAQQTGYSSVTILAGQDENGDTIRYTAGNDSGKNLEIQNDWGSQEMAARILEKIRGYQYQPYAATGAMIDPAAEIGDAVTVGPVYSGVFHRNVRLSRLMRADICAALETDAEHDIDTGTAQERQFRRYSRLIAETTTLITQNANEIKLEVSRRQADTAMLQSSITQTANSITTEINARKSDVAMLKTSITQTDSKITAEVTARQKDIGDLKASLSVLPGQIDAKVSNSNTSSSFGWSLLPASWTLTAGSKEILKADKNGLAVAGTITATSGKIGGFDIGSKQLSYNGQTWGGTNTTGIYIGTSGIQLGTAFKVSSAGKITATDGEFTGTIKCDKLYVKNSSGGFDAIATNTIQSSLSGGASYASSGWGSYNAASVAGGANCGWAFDNISSPAKTGKAQWLRAVTVSCDYITCKEFNTPTAGKATWKLLTFKNGSGQNETRTFLCV